MAAKTICVEQRFELLAKLGANTNWEVLSPSGVQALIDSPHNAGVRFTEFLRNGGRARAEPIRAWSTWKTIKLGTGIKDGAGFRRAIKSAKMKIDDLAAGDILDKPEFIVSKEPIELDLVLVTVAELGFKHSTAFYNICAEADKLGLGLCPAEAGPQLRLQYIDQPNDECVAIAMHPIWDSYSDLDVFSVGCDVCGGRWLRTCDGRPLSVWGPGHRLVFVRRK